MHANATLLVAEDEEPFCEAIERAFREPTPEMRSLYGPPDFHIDIARTTGEARQLLRKARDTYRPYDVLLLDLQMPADSNPTTPKRIREGVDVLRDEADEHACSSVVVQSHFANIQRYPEVAPILDLPNPRALDFVPKEKFGKDCEQLFRSVVQAYRCARGRQAQHWLAFCEERARQWYRQQTAAFAAEQVGAIAAEGMGRILEHARDLEALLATHYHIRAELDRNNPIYRALQGLKAAARETMTQCESTHERIDAGAPVPPAAMTRVQLSALTLQALDALRSGFAYRRLTVEPPAATTHSVVTFAADLLAILKELLFQAVDTAQEGSTLQMRVAITPDRRRASVTVESEFRRESLDAPPDRLPQVLAERLFLARKIAQDIGARLETKTADTRVQFTILIPHSPDRP